MKLPNIIQLSLSYNLNCISAINMTFLNSRQQLMCHTPQMEGYSTLWANH